MNLEYRVSGVDGYTMEKSDFSDSLVLKFDNILSRALKEDKKKSPLGAIMCEIDNHKYIIEPKNNGYTNVIADDDKVQTKEIITVKEAKKDCMDFIETAYDDDLDSWVYMGIGSEEEFKTEKEAVEYEFKTDELYKYIKDLPLNAKVIRRYAGSSEEDCSLISYIPYL